MSETNPQVTKWTLGVGFVLTPVPRPQ
jgi:hypothetical protein